MPIRLWVPPTYLSNILGGNLDAHKVMGATHVPRQHFGRMLGAHNNGWKGKDCFFMIVLYYLFASQ